MKTGEPAKPRDPVSASILGALQKEAMGMDSLQEQTGLTTDVLIAQLCVLEIGGEITRESGNRYRLINR